jgi:hypothetical protein
MIIDNKPFSGQIGMVSEISHWVSLTPSENTAGGLPWLAQGQDVFRSKPVSKLH